MSREMIFYTGPEGPVIGRGRHMTHMVIAILPLANRLVHFFTVVDTTVPHVFSSHLPELFSLLLIQPIFESQTYSSDRSRKTMAR